MKRPVIVDGPDAFVTLTKGYVATIDSEDLALVDIGNWTAVEAFGSAYAYRKSPKSEGNKTIYMHRVIMGDPEGLHVDHIDGDRLNNRKSNLRVCSSQQNQYNSGIRSSNSSGYKGVSWSKEHGKWAARIRHLGKKKHLGYYENIKDAANAYLSASIKIQKEYAFALRGHCSK